MKVYLAHNFAARVWLKDYILLLEKFGHTCTSEWISSDDEDNALRYACRETHAIMDIGCILDADALVLFTDQYGSTPGRGKYIELGYAMALGKKVILYGSEESMSSKSCIFYALPNIKKANTFQEVLSYFV